MNINWNLDWITFTTKLTPTPADPDKVGIHDALGIAQAAAYDLNLGAFHGTSVTSDRFYRYIFTDPTTGVRISVADDVADQGIRVELGGKSIAQLWSVAFIAHRAAQYDFKTTRFDVSLDIFDSGFTVADFIEEYQAAHTDRGRRTVKTILSPNGDTLYIGSRQSEKMLRIYDKGKEQRTQLDWIRFEIEVKGLPAQAWFQTAAQEPLSMVETMLGMLDLPDNPVVHAIEGLLSGETELPVIERKPKGSREAWLRTQVLSAFSKLWVEDEEAAQRVLNDFMGAAGFPSIDE